MRKAKLLHIGKLLLIVLLIVSALLLARASGYYDELLNRLSAPDSAESGSAEDVNVLSSAELAAAVRPRTVLVRTQSGVITASAYGGEETDAEFHRFSAILGEALGSAGEPEEIDEKAFRKGIESGCVFMDFFCGEPLELLANWLGSAMHGAAAAAETRALYLGLTDLTVQLCYRDGEGRFFRCTTAAMSETLSARMGEFQGSTASFAYTDRTLKNLDPYTVLLSPLPELRIADGTAVREGVDTDELMQLLGMNSFVASSYVEADGTKVFIDNRKTLRLGPDGTVTYRADAEDGERSIAEGLPAAVSGAYAAAVRSAGRYAGDAGVTFAGVLRGGGDSYTVLFDYCLGGVPLRLSSGSAAQFTVEAGQITDARLNLRSYTFTEEIAAVLPMQQAAAIAAAAGITPTLAYGESGGQVRPSWVKD